MKNMKMLALGIATLMFSPLVVNAWCDEDEKEKKEHKCGLEPGQLRKELGKDAAEGEIREHFKKHHPDGRCHCKCDHARVDKEKKRLLEEEKKRHEECKDKDRDGKKPGPRKDEVGKDCDRRPPQPPLCPHLREKIERMVREHLQEGCDWKPGENRPREIKRPPGCKCPKEMKEHRHDCKERRNHEEAREEGSHEEGDHDGKHDRRRGNNGVGNGEDGAPPGHPRENDGAGTGPGNPGNRRGGNRR